MKYEIINKEYDKPLIDRILDLRGIEDKKKFLNPSYQNSWYDSFLLFGMKESIERLLQAIKNDERIVIFGDYDVDGITSTYIIFYFIHKHLNYKNISIRLPSRADGYGIRKHHIDELKQKDVKLVITVDNGITAVEEIDHAKQLGIDVIVTDHHKPLENIPSPYSIINPKIAPDYPFKELAGVGIAFKFVTACASRLELSSKKKQQMMNYFLPIVAIGTVSDCVPLIDENRLLVKKGLEIINNTKKRPPNINHIINYLNLKNVDSYHIGFVIGPRLNASGRVHKPDNSFQVLYQHTKKHQISYLEKLENMNTERKSTQDDILKEVEQTIDFSKNILVAHGDFHEGVIGIVAGRITEKYNKPSIIMHIDKNKNEAVGSCRAPAYFSIVDMLEYIGGKHALLERYGGHAQAGGLTCKLDNIDDFKQYVHSYGENILAKDLEKINFLDTKIQEKDLFESNIDELLLLAPFGEQNKEPIFLLEDVKIKKIDTVGKLKNHIKIYGQLGQIDITLLKWSGNGFLDKIKGKKTISVVVNIQRDNFNGGYFFKIKDLVE